MSDDIPFDRSFDLAPETVEEVVPGVRRVLADNPSPFTFKGTVSYIVGRGRVAIIDWDVHHGNGTQAIFWDDPTVLFVSLHQWPFYPGTGGPSEQTDTILNVPMSAGSGDDEYLRAFDHTVAPALERFRPELVLVSAGFDAHLDDPLAQMRLTEDGFRELARRTAALAPRLAAILEGGYNLATLPSLVRAALEGFSDAA